MLEIIGMTKEELLGLSPDTLKRPSENRLLIGQEFVYIAQTLGAFWSFDYEAAKRGKIGMHAILKSKLHSDGFFVSRILLQYQNIKTIMADQQVMRFLQLGIPKPDWIAGIPDGATELGKEVAHSLGTRRAEMEKNEGKIALVSSIPADESLLLVEDFCTRGTGFTEAVLDIWSKQPRVRILPLELVLLNRGGLKEIVIKDKLTAQVVAVVNHRVKDWTPLECPLCKMGSEPIEPKATDENWRLITSSQR